LAGLFLFGAHPAPGLFVGRFTHARGSLPSDIICFCIGAVAPLAMVGWMLLR